MKILITGAGGNFCETLIPMLESAGHELVLLDIEKPDHPRHEAVQADVRDAAAVMHAMQGCGAVIHAMAYHGNMAGRRNEKDYYDVNVTGTHNVIRAMHKNSVPYLVFSSSEVVYGRGMRDRIVMDETVPCEPDWIYPLTKVLCEEMLRYEGRKQRVRSVALRYGCFVPSPRDVQGMGRLGNWLSREDVARANVCAMEALVAGKITFEPLLIHCHKRFGREDWDDLQGDPLRVVEKYYPGAESLIKKHNLQVEPPRYLTDISRAREVIGYEPRDNFEQFLETL